MKIMVTGGAGFIGSHLCEALVKDHNNQIICYDNFNDFYSPKIKRNNVSKLLSEANFSLWEADITNKKEVMDCLTTHQVELIIHLACLPGVRPSLEFPARYNDVNMGGTSNILEACHELGIKRLVFASSSSVYGNNPQVPFKESHSVDRPISVYAYTKKAGELMCHTYHHLYDLSVVCLRFFTVYGPRQRPDLAIHKFTRMISTGEEIPVFGNGTSERDYTYIDDIIGGVIAARDYVLSGHRYDIFNLGESQTITLNEMIATIENELGMRAKRKIMGMQAGDVNRTYADISRAKTILGYNPRFDFKTGIKNFVNWYHEVNKAK